MGLVGLEVRISSLLARVVALLLILRYLHLPLSLMKQLRWGYHWRIREDAIMRRHHITDMDPSRIRYYDLLTGLRETPSSALTRQGRGHTSIFVAQRSW